MNTRIASVALRLALLLSSPFLLVCGGLKNPNSVAVTIPALPTGAVSVEAVLKLDGRQVGNETFTQELMGAGPRLAFTLPPGTRGALEVELLAKDMSGCVIARSVETIQISADMVRTINASFGKLPMPVISQVSKKYLPNDQDTALTITGQYLYVCSDVQIGNQAVKDLQFQSTTQISLTVPARKGTCGSGAVSAIKLTGKDGQVVTRSDLLSFFPPTPSYKAPDNITTSVFVKELLVDDVTGDQELDLIIQGMTPTDYPMYLPGIGDGTFNASIFVPRGTGATEWRGLLTADVNGDQRRDLVIGTTVGTPYVLSTHLQSTTGVLQSPITTPVSNLPRRSDAGDLNGDGKIDLITEYDTGFPFQLGVVLGKGDGTFDTTGLGASLFAPMTPPSVTSFKLADINRDGKLDILMQLFYGGMPYEGLQFRLGNGNAMFQPIIKTGVCSSGGSMAVGDMNGDQNLDVFSGLNVCRGDGMGGFVEQAQLFPAPRYPEIADLNGDGIADLIIVQNDGADLAIRLGNGDNTFRAVTGITPTAQAEIYRLGDFNGDGFLDLVMGMKAQMRLEVRLFQCN
jgi:hypothetical protein